MISKVSITPEPRKSSLDELAENIDQDPAFQNVVGKKVDPPTAAPASTPLAVKSVHEWFVPTEFSAKVLEGINKSFDMHQLVGGGRLVADTGHDKHVLNQERFGADAALMAILYVLHGKPEGAEFMKGIRDALCARDSFGFVALKYGSGVYTLEANAAFALAQLVVEKDPPSALQRLVNWRQIYGPTGKGGVFHDSNSSGVHEIFSGNTLAALVYHGAGYRMIGNEIDAALRSGSQWTHITPQSDTKSMTKLVMAYHSSNPNDTRPILFSRRATLARALYEACCGDRAQAVKLQNGLFDDSKIIPADDAIVILKGSDEVAYAWENAMCALVSMAIAARKKKDA